MLKILVDSAPSRGIDWLTHHTNPGLFVGSGAGPRFWIFDSVNDRIALQLDATAERPAFSYYELGRKPIAIGAWMGPVTLELRAPQIGSAYGEAGFICAYRNRILVKANGPDGVGKQLAIRGFGNRDYAQSSIFYRRWKLMSVGKDKMSWFASPERVPRMTPYLVIDGWSAPAITLCSSEPN